MGLSSHSPFVSQLALPFEGMKTYVGSDLAILQTVKKNRLACRIRQAAEIPFEIIFFLSV